MRNPEALKRKIAKVIKRMPTEVGVFEAKKSKYKGATADLEFMFNMEMAFSVEGVSRTVLTETGYKIIKPKISAMAIVDNHTSCIKHDHIFMIKGNRYLVKAIDDIGELGAVFRFLLEEVE